jgi:hypothetical protein
MQNGSTYKVVQMMGDVHMSVASAEYISKAVAESKAVFREVLARQRLRKKREKEVCRLADAAPEELPRIAMDDSDLGQEMAADILRAGLR